MRFGVLSSVSIVPFGFVVVSAALSGLGAVPVVRALVGAGAVVVVVVADVSFPEMVHSCDLVNMFFSTPIHHSFATMFV